jgi:hypothetical protein
VVYSQTITTPCTFYSQITFPALTVTVLTPGEEIIMVCSLLGVLVESHFQSWEAENGTILTTGQYPYLSLVGTRLMTRVFVPANAVTLTPSSSPTSTSVVSNTTNTITTPISSGTSSPSLAGPIAGGVVGFVVVIGVVAGLLFIFVRKPKARPSDEAPRYEFDGGEPGYHDSKSDVPENTGVRGSTGLRYLEDIRSETSGRVVGDY